MRRSAVHMPILPAILLPAVRLERLLFYSFAML